MVDGVENPGKVFLQYEGCESGLVQRNGTADFSRIIDLICGG